MNSIDETTMALWGRDVWEGRLAVSDSLPSMPVRLEVSTVVICRRGSMTVVIDDRAITLQANQILFIVPGTIVADATLADEAECMVCMITRAEIFRTSLHHRPVDLIQTLRNNPVVSIDDVDVVIADAYQRLTDLVIHDSRRRPYRQQVVYLLIDSFVYEMLNLLTAHMEPAEYWSPLFQRFIVLADGREGTLRSVDEAARELCVSPKHLSHVVKESCGLTPLEYLDMLTLQAIVCQLRQTDLPLKEIALSFGFSSASSFGTYIRHHLATTPTRIRIQGRRRST